jgi:hypothetical protein
LRAIHTGTPAREELSRAGFQGQVARANYFQLRKNNTFKFIFVVFLQPIKK